MASSVIGIVFNEDRQKVLIVKRRDVDVWVLPGGGVDVGETSEDAVCRELLEETGLTVKIVRKVAQYTPINALAKLTDVFECSRIAGELATGDETGEIQYCPVDHLPHNFFHIHKKWLRDALKNKEEVIFEPIREVTYLSFFLYFLRHPRRVILFLASRIKGF
jgi:8-oxo-dGTP diphosphatase